MERHLWNDFVKLSEFDSKRSVIAFKKLADSKSSAMDQYDKIFNNTADQLRKIGGYEVKVVRMDTDEYYCWLISGQRIARSIFTKLLTMCFDIAEEGLMEELINE